MSRNYDSEGIEMLRRCHGAATKPIHKKYDITGAAEASMLAVSHDRCFCCEASIKGKSRGEWVIDHDHDTGEVRGILCRNCNTTIGKMGDTKDRILARSAQLIAYIDRTPVAQASIAMANEIWGYKDAPISKRWTMRVARNLWGVLGVDQRWNDAVAKLGSVTGVPRYVLEELTCV